MPSGSTFIRASICTCGQRDNDGQHNVHHDVFTLQRDCCEHCQRLPVRVRVPQHQQLCNRSKESRDLDQTALDQSDQQLQRVGLQVWRRLCQQLLQRDKDGLQQAEKVTLRIS